MKTLEKTTFDKIEVGEVFAYEGCWQIGIKENNGSRILAKDYGDFFDSGCFFPYDKWISFHDFTEVYRLPKSVQGLWMEV